MKEINLLAIVETLSPSALQLDYNISPILIVKFSKFSAGVEKYCNPLVNLSILMQVLIDCGFIRLLSLN